MEKPDLTMAEQVEVAASLFEQQRTGHGRIWVTVFLNEDTMVISLHGALTAAEKALADCPSGGAQLQEFHRQLFTNDSTSFWRRITRITGMEVRDATAEVETTTGTVVQVLRTNTVVQEFLLNQRRDTLLFFRGAPMEILVQTALPLAAIGYSIVYLLAGGGVFGAIVIFIIAKIFRR